MTPHSVLAILALILPTVALGAAGGPAADGPEPDDRTVICAMRSLEQ